MCPGDVLKVRCCCFGVTPLLGLGVMNHVAVQVFVVLHGEVEVDNMLKTRNINVRKCLAFTFLDCLLCSL